MVAHSLFSLTRYLLAGFFFFFHRKFATSGIRDIMTT